MSAGCSLDSHGSMDTHMRIFHRGWTHLLMLLLVTLPLAGIAQASDTGPKARVHGGEGKAERPRIALVLSGGGAKGAAHIGVLKVLEEKRFRLTSSSAPAWAPMWRACTPWGSVPRRWSA